MLFFVLTISWRNSELALVNYKSVQWNIDAFHFQRKYFIWMWLLCKKKVSLDANNKKSVMPTRTLWLKLCTFFYTHFNLNDNVDDIVIFFEWDEGTETEMSLLTLRLHTWPSPEAIVKQFSVAYQLSIRCCIQNYVIHWNRIEFIICVHSEPSNHFRHGFDSVNAYFQFYLIVSMSRNIINVIFFFFYFAILIRIIIS